MKFITQDQMKKYVKSMNTKLYAPTKLLLSDMFPHSSTGLIELLLRMVEFNPSFRPTVKQCLKSRVFDRVRKPSLEVDAPFKLSSSMGQAG